MSDAVLVSGDEDIRVGVQQAQEFGVRVHLVGIKPSRGSQSLFLLQEADRTYEWSDEEISQFLTCKPKIVVPVGDTPAATVILEPSGAIVAADPLEAVALRVADALQRAELSALIEAYESAHQLPRDVDRRLLAGGRSAVGHDLVVAEKKQVRATFLFRCRRRLAE